MCTEVFCNNRTFLCYIKGYLESFVVIRESHCPEDKKYEAITKGVDCLLEDIGKHLKKEKK